MKHVASIMTLSAVVLLSSCITTTKTARTAATSSSIKNATVADLRVADHRISYTMSPSKAIQRAGLSNVKQAVIQEALTSNGNADVMVEPEFVIEKEKLLFGSRINSITVTGRPAYYENFRTLPDSVWHKPGFYGQPDVVYVCSCNGDDCDGIGSKHGGIAGLLGKRSNKNSNKLEIEDTGWRRSGMGVYLTFMGGYEKWNVGSGHSIGSYTLGDLEDHGSYFGGMLTVGYNVTPHLFLGVGAGAFWSERKNMCNVPIYGNVRYNFSGRKLSTWFLDYKGGMNLVPNTKSMKNGFMLAFSMGRDFGRFELAAQIMYMQAKNNEDIYWSKSTFSSVKWEVPHVGLVMGVVL